MQIDRKNFLIMVIRIINSFEEDMPLQSKPKVFHEKILVKERRACTSARPNPKNHPAREQDLPNPTNQHSFIVLIHHFYLIGIYELKLYLVSYINENY